VLAENAGTTPPTAQFPPAEPAHPAPPASAPTPAPSAPTPPGATSPATAAPPSNSPAATPPAGAAAPPAPSAYTYPPPPYPYAYPELVPTSKPAPKDSDEIVTLTISPLHLIFPILQLTGELRVTPHLGVSVIGGYGTIAVQTSNIDTFQDTRVSAFELGGRVIGYPLKQFKSLQLGAQLMYLKVDTGGAISGTNISGSGAGVAFGPFAGYKVITRVGFTFVAQFGIQYLSAQAEAHNTTGASDSAKDNRFLPLLNLEIGWSF
jgi:hypothetical protein